MSGGRIEAEAGRQLERVFGIGVVGGLSDAELLERFAAVDEGAAGAAFEAIVARHGPMVLRVCRRALRDAHAAEDAFQATFLVLARRARALGERELLGNWLHGVALRTSRKARLAAARRVARDRVAAGGRSETVVDPAPGERGDYERGRILHEEIGRLPGSYRAAVVACYLEGLTHAQAARQLRLAESTVRGRLARARKLLGHRLTRRGIAQAVGLLALQGAVEAGLLRAASTTAARLPEVVVRSVARDALRFARSAGPATRGAVSSTALALADGVLSTMWLPSFKTASLAAALATVGFGLTAAGAAGLGRPVARAESPPPQQSSEPSPQASRGAKAGPPAAVDPELAKFANLQIFRTVPVAKDCMVLSYLPGWNFGGVDNIGIGNPDGGNRTLIDWPEIPAEEAAEPALRFVLAIYSRQTVSNPPAGPIVAFEVLEPWEEKTSWNSRPRYDPEPFATFPFEPGDGWKLFDVTPAVRARARDRRQGHGILLRFLCEEASGAKGTLSQYSFVSREGAGEWAGRHPVLLIVKDTESGKAETR
jgi:RNA polymerase sigma factor (sigma-70 family)